MRKELNLLHKNENMLSEKNEVILSVVITVYNSSQYLEECIKSVMNQTEKNIEIICVNDGSTDRSKDILDEYERKDDRIRVINQINQGRVFARRNGYLASKGKYITIIDGDDWVEPDIYEKVISIMKKDDSQIGIFNFYKDFEKHRKEGSSYLRHIKTSNFDIIFQFGMAGFVKAINPYGNNYEGFHWNKVYRKSLWDRAFEKGEILTHDPRHFEDAITNIPIFLKAKTISIIPIYGYHWRRDNYQSGSRIFYKDLPSKNDADFYNEIAKRVGISNNEVWIKVLSASNINMFITYITNHYFVKENEISLRKQIQEINKIIKGKKLDSYFSISIKGYNSSLELIDSRLIRSLIRFHLVNPATLLIYHFVSRMKQRMSIKNRF